MSVVKTENEHLYASGGLRIPYEVADGITLAVLQDHLSYLRQELKEHLEEGKWMHPEDVIKSREEYIPALKTLVKFFGGEDA